jgi:hypothetical protein
VGASLLAKNDNAVNQTEFLPLRINVIQRAVHRQLRQHDDLRATHYRFSHGEEVAAMCEVRKPVIGTRPDKSLPAHSRHNAFTDSG